MICSYIIGFMLTINYVSVKLTRKTWRQQQIADHAWMSSVEKQSSSHQHTSALGLDYTSLSKVLWALCCISVKISTSHYSKLPFCCQTQWDRNRAQSLV